MGAVCRRVRPVGSIFFRLQCNNRIPLMMVCAVPPPPPRWCRGDARPARGPELSSCYRSVDLEFVRPGTNFDFAASIVQIARRILLPRSRLRASIILSVVGVMPFAGLGVTSLVGLIECRPRCNCVIVLRHDHAFLLLAEVGSNLRTAWRNPPAERLRFARPFNASLFSTCLHPAPHDGALHVQELSSWIDPGLARTAFASP